MLVEVTILLLFTAVKCDVSSPNDLLEGIKNDHTLSQTNSPYDPCANFYKFSCENWITHTTKPKSSLYWNKWQELEKLVNKRVQRLLQRVTSTSQQTSLLLNKILSQYSHEILDDPSTEPLNKAALLYNSCLVKDDSEKLYAHQLRLLIRELGGWPLVSPLNTKFDWIIQIAEITAQFDVFPIFKFKIDVDLENRSRYLFSIKKGETILPTSILTDPSGNQKIIKTYKNWIYATVKHLYPSQNVKYEDIVRLVEFEIKLAKLMENVEDDSIKAKLNNYSTASKVNFILAFKLMFHRDFIEILKENATVISSHKYVKQVIKLANITEPKIVANYLMWFAVKQMTRDTTRTLRKLNFLMDKSVFDMQLDTSTEEDCARMVIDFMPLALIPRYSEVYIKQSSIASVEQMVKNIKLEFIEILKRVSWISNTTKIEIVEKVEAITYEIGYSKRSINSSYLNEYYQMLHLSEDHFLNVLKLKRFARKNRIESIVEGTSSQRWQLNPFDVNAGYSVLNNSILIPLTMLEKPFFDPQHLASTYGSLGSIIGHELSHSLDVRGKKADKNGYFTNYWSDSDNKSFNKKLECFYDKYNAYGVDGQQSIGENIADNVGLKLSVAAFRKINQSRSDIQKFFIAFAQTWCELPTSNEFLKVDIYAPEEIRVLVSTSNNEDFIETFNCSASLLENKCTLW